MAMRILNCCVAAKWLWFSPILVHILQHIREVIALQATMMIVILHLFLPDDLKSDVALCLNRIRRRAVHVFLSGHAGMKWSTMWRARSWGYLGHVLRRPPDRMIRKIFLDFAVNTRPQGGFPNTPLRWLQTQAALAFRVPGVDHEQLQSFASDRDVWRAAGDRHWKDVAREEHHSFRHDSHWPHWRHSILQHVPWMFSCVLCQLTQLILVWIDEIEGPQSYSMLGDSLAADLLDALRHVRMQYCTVLGFCP